MKPCPCGATPTTSSDIVYSVVWCRACHKTLTREYIHSDLAILAWQHGVENLPAPCPFCLVGDCWPPDIHDPESETPKVSCGWPNCPLEGKVFTLEGWNRCKPKARAFEDLLKRWSSRKDRYYFRSQILSLKRAIATHLHGGRYERSRLEPAPK